MGTSPSGCGGSSDESSGGGGGQLHPDILWNWESTSHWPPQRIPLSLCLIASTVSVVYTITLERKGSDPAPFSWDGVITQGALAMWFLGMESRVVVDGGTGLVRRLVRTLHIILFLPEHS